MSHYEPRDVIRVCLSVDEDGYAPIHVDEAVLAVGADSIEVTVPHTHFTVSVYYRDVHRLELVKPATNFMQASGEGNTGSSSSSTRGAAQWAARLGTAAIPPPVQLVFHTGIFSHRRYLLSSSAGAPPPTSGSPPLMEMLYDVLRDRIIERDVPFPHMSEPTHAALMGRYFGSPNPSTVSDSIDPRAVWATGNDGRRDAGVPNAAVAASSAALPAGHTHAAASHHQSLNVSAIRGASPSASGAAAAISRVPPPTATTRSTPHRSQPNHEALQAETEPPPPLRMWETSPAPTQLTTYASAPPYDLATTAPAGRSSAISAPEAPPRPEDPRAPKRTASGIASSDATVNTTTAGVDISELPQPSASGKSHNPAVETPNLPPRPISSATRGSPVRSGYPASATPIGQRTRSEGRATTADAAVQVTSHATEANARQHSVMLSPPAGASMTSPVGALPLPPQGPVLSPPPPVWLLKRNLKEMEHRDALLHTPPQVPTAAVMSQPALTVAGGSFLLRDAVQPFGAPPFSLAPTPNVVQYVLEIKAQGAEFRLGAANRDATGGGGGEFHEGSSVGQKHRTSPLPTSVAPLSATSSPAGAVGHPLNFAGEEVRSLDDGISSAAAMQRGMMSLGYDGTHDEFFESASYTAPTVTTANNAEHPHHALRPTTVASQDAESEVVQAAERRLRSLSSIAALDTKRSKLQRDDVLIAVARRAATSPRVLPLPARRTAPPLPASSTTRAATSVAAPPLPASHSARRESDHRAHAGGQEQRLNKTYTGIAVVQEGSVVVDDRSSEGGEGYNIQAAATDRGQRGRSTGIAAQALDDHREAAAATAVDDGEAPHGAAPEASAPVAAAAGEAIEQPRRIPAGPNERPAVRNKTFGGVPMPHLVAAAGAAASAGAASGGDERAARYQSARSDIGTGQIFSRR